MTEHKAKPDEESKTASAPKSRASKVKIRHDRDSWGRKRGTVAEVPGDVAEKLVRDGHATRI